MGLNQEERTKLFLLRHEGVGPTGWRSFVHIWGGHDKFWRIGRAGMTVYTQYGRNGTDGTTTMKRLSSIGDAMVYVNTKIHEKFNKGYEEL